MVRIDHRHVDEDARNADLAMDLEAAGMKGFSDLRFENIVTVQSSGLRQGHAAGSSEVHEYLEGQDPLTGVREIPARYPRRSWRRTPRSAAWRD